MSTNNLASAVFPLSVDFVWRSLRDFSFPQKLLCSAVSKVELEDAEGRPLTDPFSIGVIRKVHWKTGEWRKHRLLELNDQYHTLRWELVDSHPHSEVTAVISRVKCTRISETNHTLVEWSSEYSSDVSQELLKFDLKSFQQNLNEIRFHLTSKQIPTIYHIHEGPSARIIWLAYELGIPTEIKESVPVLTSGRDNLRKSRESESLASTRGGMVASFVDGDIVLVESGAIVFYLLEKYDAFNRLSPPISSPLRARFLRNFFRITSTVDHLVYEAYNNMYVIGDEETVNQNKEIWDSHIANDFVNELSKEKYLCGDQFTAADVLFGWALFVANLLGWLDDYPRLREYLKVVSQRPGYIKAFSAIDF